MPLVDRHRLPSPSMMGPACTETLLFREKKTRLTGGPKPSWSAHFRGDLGRDLPGSRNRRLGNLATPLRQVVSPAIIRTPRLQAGTTRTTHSLSTSVIFSVAVAQLPSGFDLPARAWECRKRRGRCGAIQSGSIALPASMPADSIPKTRVSSGNRLLFRSRRRSAGPQASRQGHLQTRIPRRAQPPVPAVSR